MISTNDVRRTFLDYFNQQGHQIVPSDSLVPSSDPTLMFTNAGMVPFKNIFTGAQTPPAPRATSSQKCVRAGGKHNDLDNVGYTARHHTFFEMLGNFSFGDYFKEEAIHMAWQLCTKEFGLPADKLIFTVYHNDDEAFNLWKKITGKPDHQIIRIPTADNFWQMGETGPCGPCSEIFFDHGADIPGGPPGSADEDGDRFIEIWNLVFMQYDRQNDGADSPLPSPCIDTGMGLERVTAVLQGKHNNFEIDLFQNLIAAVDDYAPTDNLASKRVIADHLRASAFLMADGVLPSNEGRGYVLRRIMRRGMRHAHLLGVKEPLMHRLVPSLITEMGEAYPELKRGEAMIAENLRLEEERFQETLGRGLKLLEEEISGIQGKALNGATAFKLYDTYGFPLDLTQDILRGQNLTVDEAGFNTAMAEQKARAKAAWKGSGDATTSEVWLALRDELGESQFLGYDAESAEGELLAIVKDGAVVERATRGDTATLIFKQTPFYAESGGQQGDYGEASKQGTLLAEITDTTKPAEGLHAHHAKIFADIVVGDTLNLTVNGERRRKLRANHSATHLLNAALRQVLGDHIAQKGSEVAEDKLRFDVSHPKALTANEIAEVEQLVNAQIWQNSPASTQLMSKDEAIAAGATAMFGEKSANEVRVLTLGSLQNNTAFSVELCGGIHVDATGEIGLFKITSEGALAAGVRRIEAVTQYAAIEWLNRHVATVNEVASLAKSPVAEVSDTVATLIAERKRLEKELAEAKRKLALSGGSAGMGAEDEKIGTIDFASQCFEEISPKDLRSLATEIMAKHNADIVAVASNFEGKAAIVVAASKESGLDSAAYIRAAVPIVGGKGGGGRPEMAQGGGPDGDKVKAAIAAIRDALQAS